MNSDVAIRQLATYKILFFLFSLGRSPQPSAIKPSSGSYSRLPNDHLNSCSNQALPSAAPTRLSLNAGHNPGLSVLAPKAPNQPRDSGSSLSKALDKFRAPAPSPQSSSYLKISDNHSDSLPSNTTTTTVANKPQFKFKPKFQVPTKSGSANSSMNYSSQLTQEQTEDVETLLEGLDDDSLFGEFELP